jgi:PAS domain S-box-containing protein
MTEHTPVSSAQSATAGDLLRMAPDELRDMVSDLQTRLAQLEQRDSQLHQQHNRYRSLYESAPVAYLTIDERFAILDANITAATMFGMTREALLRTPLLDRVWQADHEPCLLHFREALSKGYYPRGEAWFVRGDGTRFFARVQIARMQGAQGSERELLVGLTNTTQQKRVEQMLRQSEQRYRFLYEESESVNIIVDREGRLLDVNQRTLEKLGYTKQEVIGQPFGNFVPPPERAVVQQRVRDLFAQKTLDALDVQMYAKDGTVRTLMCAATAVVLLEEDQPHSAMLCATDITERNRMLTELERTREQLEELLQRRNGELDDTRAWLVMEQDQRVEIEETLSRRQQALEAVYAMATGATGSLESVCERVAMTLPEVLGVSFASVLYIPEHSHTPSSAVYCRGALLHAGDTASSCPLFAHLREQGTPHQRVLTSGQICTLCGTLAPDETFQSYLGVPLLGRDGDVVGAVCCLDTHPRTFGDFEVHLVEVFARYVANEVGRHRMQAQLRHAQEMKMLGQLTSGVAHEVRNPLNAIMAVLEALFLTVGDNPELEPFRTHLNRQVSRLSQLMEDLLALGRPLKQEHIKPLRLGALLTEVQVSLRHAALPNQATVELALCPETEQWLMHGDTLRLQQVFINLLENALQHAPPGTRVLLTTDQPGPHTARVRVVDSGKGVAPENLARIFEPFYTTRKSGTGLGLCIVRRTVKEHGGEVRLYNNESAPGLTAEITLPLVS